MAYLTNRRSNMQQEKVYIGNGKAMTGNYGTFHKLSFSAQDISTLQQNLNSKGYVNLILNERQTPSQYGATHSMTIDFWEPQQQPQGQAPQNNKDITRHPYQITNMTTHKQVNPRHFNKAPRSPRSFSRVISNRK